MGAETVIKRTLDVGDIIVGNPCRVHVFMTVGPVARVMCETCDDSHFINRAMYEAGEGPWRPVENGRNGVTK